MGIGNPGFFETYDELAAHLPSQRTFYAFHLDAQNHWLDHLPSASMVRCSTGTPMIPPFCTCTSSAMSATRC